MSSLYKAVSRHLVSLQLTKIQYINRIGVVILG
jgi:hypothetical protein